MGREGTTVKWSRGDEWRGAWGKGEGGQEGKQREGEQEQGDAKLPSLLPPN